MERLSHFRTSLYSRRIAGQKVELHPDPVEQERKDHVSMVDCDIVCPLPVCIFGRSSAAGTWSPLGQAPPVSKRTGGPGPWLWNGLRDRAGERGPAAGERKHSSCSAGFGSNGMGVGDALDSGGFWRSRGGQFGTKSLVNKRHSPAVDYSAGSISPDFSVGLKGSSTSAPSDGWVLADSQSVSAPDGTSELGIVLKNQSLEVTRHYRLYPGTGIVREWSTIKNTSERAAELDSPDFFRKTLGRSVFGKEARYGYFSGTGYDAGAQQLIWEPVSSDYRRELSSSYGGWDHMPLMAINDPSGRQGVFVGWDYLGPWAAEISAEKGDSIQVHLALKAYHRTLQPGEQIETPQAFMGMFAGDIDDMGNGILDWQYQFYWQHKNPAYWARPRLAVDWPWSLERNLNWIQRGGTSENWAYWLHLDLYFTDLARYAGAGSVWNDAGWYDEFGSWNGPAFGEVNKYLKKHGMSMIVWFPTHLRYAGCDADRRLSESVPPRPGNVIDQSSPEVTDWQQHLLNQKVSEWGDFQWRWDVKPGEGSDPLAADQEMRKLTRQFITDHAESAIDAGSAGGASWFGVELAGYACASEMTDGKGVQDYGGYYATLMAPPDMLHWIILAHHQGRKNYSINSDRAHLRMHPVWYADPGTSMPYQNRGQNTEYQTASTLGVRPASIPGLESLRRDWDLYKYFLSKGVAGQWSHVFRPHVEGDHEFLYFQRMNREGTQGVVLTTRLYNEPEKMPDGQVIVYPKGLVSDRDYDVRFDFDPRVFHDSGGGLMTKGIVIPKLQPGEIVFLNLADHPGSHTDKVPPSAPSQVTKRVATNVYTQGVEVAWSAGTDDRRVSCYEVFRIAPSGEETPLGKVAQGTFFFDRSLPAFQLINCDYQVRTVDGDGNVSERVKARRQPGEPETHYGFSGFGNRPAFRGWSCEATVDGKTFQPLSWDSKRGYEGRWCWEQDAGVIGRTYMRAHPSADIARVFTVRRPGKVVLEGTVLKDLPPAQPQSEDCYVRIMKNDEQAWPPTDWARVPVDRKGVGYKITVDVQAGDRLVFMLKRAAAYLGSSIDWNPAIRYVSEGSEKLTPPA